MAQWWRILLTMPGTRFDPQSGTSHLGEDFPKPADWSDLEHHSLPPSLFPSRALCAAHLGFHHTPPLLLAFPCLHSPAAFFPSAGAYFFFFFNQPQTPLPTSRAFLAVSSSALWLTIYCVIRSHFLVAAVGTSVCSLSPPCLLSCYALSI